MKKFMKGLVLGILAILIGGATLMYGCTALFVNTADKTMQEMKQKDNALKAQAQEIVDDMNWRQEGDYLVGDFTNTTDKEISYLEIEYKLFDSNGKVIEKSFTNETDIAPGETREIKIILFGINYSTYELKVSSANHYDED